MRRPPLRPQPWVCIVLWVARLGAAAVVLILSLIVFGEPGSGPAGVREWIYLALYPFGFATGYLIGWRWPLWGGCLSWACMVLSWLVIGRIFDGSAYLIWAVTGIPGVLYIVAGWGRRHASAAGRPSEGVSSA